MLCVLLSMIGADSKRPSSYPTSWNPAMASASGAPSYPATTIASDPYLKSAFATDAPEIASHMPSSMPSMSLSLVSSDQAGQQSSGPSSQVPPIRTQYASYVQTSTAPPPLSASATSGTSLSVPRYVEDSNPRPTKSPRNPSHPSIQSSISSTDSANEYRYGPHYGSISSASADISPQTTQNASYSTTGSGSNAQDSSAGASATGSSSTVPPPRDYFPPSTPWTATSGESSAPTYTNGDHRASYSYEADQYKTPGIKSEPHAPPAPVYPGPAMSHYSWNAS